MLACVSMADDPCPSGQRSVCRAAGDCRCAPPCSPGRPCSVPGTPVCVELVDLPGSGACVDASWLTGAPTGSIRCGASICPATASCVDWGSAVGLRCATPCRGNADCPSGCCTQVNDPTAMRTLTLCAPDTRFRCMPGDSGRRCEPPCAPGETCLDGVSRPRCARTCSEDKDCPATCCAEIEGGGRACAPTLTDCRSALTPACSNLDACITVTYAARGDHCGASADSVEVRVRNDCTHAADIQICFPRRDGGCTCGIHRFVAPGSSADPPFWACNVQGRYTLSARAAGDAPGCHPNGC
jgi:hypothetical protein